MSGKTRVECVAKMQNILPIANQIQDEKHVKNIPCGLFCGEAFTVLSGTF